MAPGPLRASSPTSDTRQEGFLQTAWLLQLCSLFLYPRCCLLGCFYPSQGLPCVAQLPVHVSMTLESLTLCMRRGSIS